MIPVYYNAYGDESDPGPMPIPLDDSLIEGGPDSTGDRHVLVLDRDRGRVYELFGAYPGADNWTAASGAIFDLNSTGATRPLFWTSADAAGMSLLAGLVRYDEVEAGEVNHAIRFTLDHVRKGFTYPASHFVGYNTATNVPPMGARFRLKASFDISTYPRTAQVILKAMKRYGLILADIGTSWFFGGASDARWNDDELNTLKQVRASDFEMVQLGPVITLYTQTAAPGAPTTVAPPLVICNASSTAAPGAPTPAPASPPSTPPTTKPTTAPSSPMTPGPSQPASAAGSTHRCQRRSRHRIAATSTTSARACSVGGSQPRSRDNCPKNCCKRRGLRYLVGPLDHPTAAPLPQQYEMPMSTEIWVPVTNRDPSEASHATASAMSSGWAVPSGSNDVFLPRSSGYVSPAARMASRIRPPPIGVATAPGCTLLTRMLWRPSSAANARAIPVTACLLAT